MPNERRIHRPTRLFRLLYWVCIFYYGLGVLYGGWLSATVLLNWHTDGWLFLLLGLLIVMSGSWAIKVSADLLALHLITSPSGLEYHGPTYHLHTPWSNAKNIAITNSVYRLFNIESIILSAPPELLTPNWFSRWQLQKFKGIELYGFGPWRHTALGEEIRKYAPWLLA